MNRDSGYGACALVVRVLVRVPVTLFGALVALVLLVLFVALDALVVAVPMFVFAVLDVLSRAALRRAHDHTRGRAGQKTNYDEHGQKTSEEQGDLHGDSVDWVAAAYHRREGRDIAARRQSLSLAPGPSGWP